MFCNINYRCTTKLNVVFVFDRSMSPLLALDLYQSCISLMWNKFAKLCLPYYIFVSFTSSVLRTFSFLGFGTQRVKTGHPIY